LKTLDPLCRVGKAGRGVESELEQELANSRGIEAGVFIDPKQSAAGLV
jgi:hypothetical protein